MSLDSHLDGDHDDDDGDNNDDEDDDVGNDDAVGDDYDNQTCHWTAILMVVMMTVMVRMFLIAIMTWYLSPENRPCLPIILYYNDCNFHIGARMSLVTKNLPDCLFNVQDPRAL